MIALSTARLILILALETAWMMALLQLIFIVVMMKSTLINCRSEEERLSITELTDRMVDLVYTDLPSGRGLRVVSAQDSLYINTLDGRSIVAAEEASGSTDGSLRLISIGRNMFIQAQTSDFLVPDAFAGILSNGNNAVLQDLMQILINSSDIMHESDNRLRDSVLTILSSEGKLLLDAVAALSSAGITGVEYPSVLPFYMAALRLAQLVQRSNLTSHVDRALSQGETEDCLNECPPCQYQQCLGMCGYSCNCWKWVCGDCCYHLGCYEHDICCRKKFVRTACLIPLNFKCGSGYNCN